MKKEKKGKKDRKNNNSTTTHIHFQKMIGLVSTPGIWINVLAREHKVILARTQSMRLGRGINAAAAKRKNCRNPQI